MPMYRITGGHHRRLENGVKVSYSKGDAIEITSEKEFNQLKPFLGLNVEWAQPEVNPSTLEESEALKIDSSDIPTIQRYLKEERAGENRDSVVNHFKETLRKLKEEELEKKVETKKK